MARLLTSLVIIALLLFGLWPYTTIFRLDTALNKSDADALTPLVDLPAVQQAYKERLGRAVDGVVPRGNSDAERVVGWLAQNLTRMGDSALGQAITMEWVRGMLRQAVEQASDKNPPALLDAVDFAFFESWNRFTIRLGEVGNSTTVVLAPRGVTWQVVDLAR